MLMQSQRSPLFQADSAFTWPILKQLQTLDTCGNLLKSTPAALAGASPLQSLICNSIASAIYHLMHCHVGAGCL